MNSSKCVREYPPVDQLLLEEKEKEKEMEEKTYQHA
jgi:hypothetical protein